MLASSQCWNHHSTSAREQDSAASTASTLSSSWAASAVKCSVMRSSACPGRTSSMSLRMLVFTYKPRSHAGTSFDR